MSLKSKIEAVLFITSNAMSIKEVAGILGEDPEQVESQMLELIMDYSSRDSALEIDDEDGYILQVKQDYIDIVEKLIPIEMKPSQLKTLSIIAVKEPIRQSVLLELRGQVARDHIQNLLELGLIEKKRDKKLRFYVLRTTPKFSEFFKLKGDTQSLSKILDLEEDLKN